jgi:hypothetical protein
MSGDGTSRTRVPLTATEAARRAAALKANRETGHPITAMVSSETMVEVASVKNGAPPEATDELLFGPSTAQMLSECWRNVALAPDDKKKTVFQEIGKRLGEAVAGQWLLKSVMMDRLLDIAVAHGYFGLDREE